MTSDKCTLEGSKNRVCLRIVLDLIIILHICVKESNSKS